jgi:hypothetical protein
MKENQLVWQLWFNYCGFTVFFIFKKFYFGVIVGYWSDTIRQTFFDVVSNLFQNEKKKTNTIRLLARASNSKGPQAPRVSKLKMSLLRYSAV